MKDGYPVTWDRHTQRLYIQVGKGGPVAKLTPVHPEIVIETDARDNLIGLEITGPAAMVLYQATMNLRIR